MSIFKKIRQQISKRRKPSKKKCRTFEVPACDYNLIKFIRISMANGDTVTTFPADVYAGFDADKSGYCNAKILHDFYDMNRQEVLEATGFWVEEK